MSKQPKKRTARPLEYVTSDGVTYTIPKGLMCVRVPGTCTQDGVKVTNPWVLHETPDEYRDNRHFLKYGKTYGYIIKEEYLEDYPVPPKVWLRKFKELCAKSDDLGTMEDGKTVPPDLVLEWARSTIGSTYAESYEPDRLLKIWAEVWHGEVKNEIEFAQTFLEECQWDTYKALDAAGLLGCFDFGHYWQSLLRHDYQVTVWEGRHFITRRDW